MKLVHDVKLWQPLRKPALREPVCRLRGLRVALVHADEEGTEAAAATVVEMMLGAAAYHPPSTVMIVDRPFFIAIRDTVTGAILFMGSVVDPAT